MDYELEPLFEGELTASTLSCKSKPSNAATTNGTLRKGVHQVKVYAKVKNEGIYWYLVNPKVEQWVAAHYIKLK